MSEQVYRYQDKPSGERPAFRVVLLLRNLALVLVVICFVAVRFPGLSAIGMTALCALMTAFIWVSHVTADRHMIFNSSNLFEDGQYLYTVTVGLHFGFGRKHFQTKSVRVRRYSRLVRVLRIRRYAFGISVRAVVDTISDRETQVHKKELLKTSGALAAFLEEKGRRRTVLLRFERNLTASAEEHLLQVLRRLES